MSKLKDLSGTTVGKLKVISLHSKGNRVKWNCLCECGNSTVVFGSNLSRWHTISCGCVKASGENNPKTHGASKTREYKIWAFIKVRCLNINCEAYPRYGGRGIKICDQWLHSFETFFRDVGPCPSKDMSLDRIDNDGNYEPGNVRWATDLEQANNKSNSIYFELNGVKDTLPNWCRVYNRPASSVWARIMDGWNFERAIVTPIRKQNNNRQ